MVELRFGTDSWNAMRPQRPVCPWKPGAWGVGSAAARGGGDGPSPKEQVCTGVPAGCARAVTPAGRATVKLATEAGPLAVTKQSSLWAQMGLGTASQKGTKCHLPPTSLSIPSNRLFPQRASELPPPGSHIKTGAGPVLVRKPSLHSASGSSPPSVPPSQAVPAHSPAPGPPSPQAGAPGALW